MCPLFIKQCPEILMLHLNDDIVRPGLDLHREIIDIPKRTKVFEKSLTKSGSWTKAVSVTANRNYCHSQKGGTVYRNYLVDFFQVQIYL